MKIRIIKYAMLHSDTTPTNLASKCTSD